MSEEQNMRIKEIDTAPLFDPFKKHLTGNQRIFFSGKFGSGKTFFLNKFFEKYADEYNVFHLFPINYQINANEDIKELLKYDILIELQKRSAFPQEKDIQSMREWFLLSTLFLQGNKREIFSCGLNIVESVAEFPIPFPYQEFLKLGHPLKEVLSLVDEFNNFKNGAVNGEARDVKDFIKNIEEKCSVDEDPLVAIIKQAVSVNPEESIKKESVLILDDLDRIDPEHIFRILNIFSARLGIDNEPNTFGFDKVILVGDVDNIESIFHHRYGKEADFSGYFDKFFDSEIFVFGIREIVRGEIPRLMNSFRKDLSTVDSLNHRNGYLGILFKDFFDFLLSLDGKDTLTIRMLLKPIRFEFLSLEKGCTNRNNSGECILKSIDIFVRFFMSFLGGKEKFISMIKKGTETGKLGTNLAKSKTTSEYIHQLLLFNGIITEENFSYSGYDLAFKDAPEKGNNNFTIQRKNDRSFLSQEEFFYHLILEYIELSPEEIRDKLRDM